MIIYYNYNQTYTTIHIILGNSDVNAICDFCCVLVFYTTFSIVVLTGRQNAEVPDLCRSLPADIVDHISKCGWWHYFLFVFNFICEHFKNLTTIRKSVPDEVMIDKMMSHNQNVSLIHSNRYYETIFAIRIIEKGYSGRKPGGGITILYPPFGCPRVNVCESFWIELSRIESQIDGESDCQLNNSDRSILILCRIGNVIV